MSYILCAVIFRVLLPILVTLCVIFRPCGLSAVYLLFLLLMPWMPVPTSVSMAGRTGIYLKCLMAVSIITTILTVAFQAVLFYLHPYAHFLESCDFLEKLLRHIGLVRLDGLHFSSASRWLLPEAGMLIGSIGSLVLCVRLTRVQTVEAELVEEKPKRKKSTFIVALGRYIALASLCVAAVLRPSIPGGFYFLVFLSSMTWWACYKELGKAFAILLRCVLAVILVHITALYASQFQWFQEDVLPKNSSYARYFGLTQILSVNCSDPTVFETFDYEVATYINPLAVLWLYYILTIQSKQLLKTQSMRRQGAFSRLEGSFNGPLTRQLSHRLSDKKLKRSATTRNRWQSATRKVRVLYEIGTPHERIPLIRGVSQSKLYGSGKKTRGVFQDSTGSVTITGEGSDDIPMNVLGLSEEPDKPTVMENILLFFESLFQFIVKTSYIATNIIMMAWSITYHCWLTFVLLLWANLLWMIPNQRRSMLRSSPFLVLYAWFLLISAYIYSMDLKDDELPAVVQDFNLAQIGFVKITDMPWKPLLVKCLYTTMFWITLRQFMQERQEARQNSALADMVAPLQVTVGTAAGVNKEEEKGESPVLKKIGLAMKKFLTKFWIWVVAITLFAVAITGQRMTAFRILYMALFLFFILCFQVSFRVWRKIMFGFWLTVIIYSMIILVLIYTYQFDNFPYYWEHYLHVEKQQQLDIGLEMYETKMLFVRLVTPTFFVIVTVVQLHYFHKDFMQLSDPDQYTSPEYSERTDATSAQGALTNTTSESVKTDKSMFLEKQKVEEDAEKKTNRKFFTKQRWSAFVKHVIYVFNMVFLFLELHMPKVVLFVGFMVCVYDKCALYLIFMLMLVLGVLTRRLVQNLAILSSSILISIVLLLRMIYQIQYIQKVYNDNLNVTCDNVNNSAVNITEKNAEWLGFFKTQQGLSLPRIVKWNIVYITVVTLWAVILVRQTNYRISKGKTTKRPFFMFPKIKRSDADKNLRNCIKYLLNYGFYKFGVEVCLMTTVALIGFRMDFYSILYSIWLCVLFALKRNHLAKVWKVYLGFISIFLFIQYIMVIGLPPGLCIEFPWKDSEILRRVQDWGFLLDNDHPPSAKKLICDFVLLLLVSRQAIVFRIEDRYKEMNHEYPGGSNESIIHLIEEDGFVNPVPDFVTFIRSYLDALKRCVLLSFLWITLAIVFLAGTNRVNIFSIGYLLGSFVFLWQGTDLYLKHIPYILNSWNWLLGYNVAVIMIKTVLQLIGCIFITDVQENACWLVQVLGIGCVKKFGNTVLSAGIVDPNTCSVPREYIGLAWDGACFGFLLMQRRIFTSFNFFHMVDESKAATILASRGAELIGELRQKRMREQEDAEKRIIEKIRAKMERIKANQQKIQGPNYQDTTNHYVEEGERARSGSMSSCTSATSQQTSPGGYHTPIDEEEPAPLTPQASSSVIPAQAPSPSSALMTGSLDAYLEPQRMSFSSPPNSELNPRPPSPDDSFPVFSPPPYDAAPPYAEAVSEATTAIQRQTSIGPPWMQGTLVTPRPSVISCSPRSPLSHHTYGIFTTPRPLYRMHQPKTYKQAIRSGDYYMFDELEDEELDIFEETKVDEDTVQEEASVRARGKRTIGELLSEAMKTNIQSTVTTDPDLRRRMSMPVTRQRSSVSARSQLSAPLSAPPTIPERAQESTPEKTIYEPQPGTSRDDDMLQMVDQETEYKKPTCCQRFTAFLKFAWAFIDSLLISIINFLNKNSKDYRYVMKVLSREKRMLKEKTSYNRGLRPGKSGIWHPLGSYRTLMTIARISLSSSSSEATLAMMGTFTPSDSFRLNLLDEVERKYSEESDVKEDISEMTDTKAIATPLPSKSKALKGEENQSDDIRRKASVLTVPEIRILAPSLERGLDSPFLTESESSGEMLKDEMEELSSVDQPTIIRLLLAIWYIVMSHSDMMCYFMIFLNQIKSATFLSLPLPLMVFFWGSLTIPRPSKTFWVTIIAYTEIIVLVKCMFQFEILPWNQNPNLVNPFYPPKIIGIERKKDYAVWDLLVLLIVFFHRFMLKSLGLWKVTYLPQQILQDGDYKVQGEQLVPLDLHQKSKRRKRKLSLSKKIALPKRLKPSVIKRINRKIARRRKSDLILAASPKQGDLQQLVEEQEEGIEDDESDHEKELEANTVHVSTNLIEPLELYPAVLKITTIKYLESIKIFFKSLMDPNSRVAADVYSYMFLCDFFNFFVILIGYSSFGSQQGDGGVSSYLEDNRVPVLFLIMLILQFMLIIIDRAIYLRRNILAKVIFQFLQIIILHLWLFVLFPLMTERSFNSVLPPQMYYMVKCFYLLLSAYQIRCGYPTRILGNFLCKGYNYVNMFLFRGFMAIPFLFELRSVMDWMWTDTSMTIFDWIKMEDIFAHIFLLKCTRHVEDEYPQPRGERKSPLVKYLMGGGLLFIIIFVIWFPMVFFSLGNAVGQPNVPYDVTLDLRIGPYEPIYQMSAQSNAIYVFKAKEQDALLSVYRKNKVATTFISNYEAADIAAVQLSTDSASVWSISPPDKDRMLQEVNSTQPLTIRLQYTVKHKSNSKEDSGIIREEVEITLPAYIGKEINKDRQDLLDMLRGESLQSGVPLQYVMPKFLKVTNRATAKPVTSMMSAYSDNDRATKYRNISIKLSKSMSDDRLEWWELHEECEDYNYIKYLSKIPFADCNQLMIYTFNDKIFPATLSILTGGGIIGLYTTFVLVIFRVVRGSFFSGIFAKIMFEDIPYVDRILYLCYDIYLVREVGDFTLEEDLFSKLIFLFRSPETLIKWTRPPEELQAIEEAERNIIR